MLVIRPDPNTNSKLGFGCSVSHTGTRKGRPKGGRTWWCSSPAKSPKKAGRATSVGLQRPGPEEDLANGPMGTWAAGSGRPVVAAGEGEIERERALGER